MKTRTVSALSLATLANLNAMIANQALAQTSDLQPPEYLSESSNTAQLILEQKLLAKDLFLRIQSDADFRAAYLADPRKTMSQFGLIAEIQREILLEEGLITPDDTDVEWECACTGCCVTSVRVG
jgi:hypothetical protein